MSTGWALFWAILAAVVVWFGFNVLMGLALFWTASGIVDDYNSKIKDGK